MKKTIDKIKNKKDLLTFINNLSSDQNFDEIIPVSAIKGTGITELESLIVKNLPNSEPFYPKKPITDRNERFFAAEFIREKLIIRLNDEVPHHLSVTIDEFSNNENIIHINACIWVEKKGQKSIVIGKDGKLLKEVGTSARLELENLYNKKVNLKTWVKVKSKWSDSASALKQFGY